jgi:hypothetical protein
MLALVVLGAVAMVDVTLIQQPLKAERQTLVAVAVAVIQLRQAEVLVLSSFATLAHNEAQVVP